MLNGCFRPPEEVQGPPAVQAQSREGHGLHFTKAIWNILKGICGRESKEGKQGHNEQRAVKNVAKVGEIIKVQGKDNTNSWSIKRAVSTPIPELLYLKVCVLLRRLSTYKHYNY